MLIRYYNYPYTDMDYCLFFIEAGQRMWWNGIWTYVSAGEKDRLGWKFVHYAVPYCKHQFSSNFRRSCLRCPTHSCGYYWGWWAKLYLATKAFENLAIPKNYAEMPWLQQLEPLHREQQHSTFAFAFADIYSNPVNRNIAQSSEAIPYFNCI